MKQMYSLADAYSTSKNSKGLVPLPVAFLSTQSSLLLVSVLNSMAKLPLFMATHPTKEAKPYQVEQARDFLTAIGVKP
jgi:malic enzyme